MSPFSCFGGKFAGIMGSRNQGRRDEAESSSAAENRAGPSAVNAGATGNTQRSPRVFPLGELQISTNYFRRGQCIGTGQSAEVFTGRLENGLTVAVKRLKIDYQYKKKEFAVEVRILSPLRHSNIIKLIGCCADGAERIIVYEFMPTGSLFDLLHDRKPRMPELNWGSRMKIAAGVAKALGYLHNEANPRVIYGDLKSSDVLLGDELHPKLSDFGKAQSEPFDAEGMVTPAANYLAPEYILTGRLTFKSDVYSFGAVLLEIITGKIPEEDTARARENHCLADRLKREKEVVKMADPKLGGKFPEERFMKAMGVVSRCVSVRPDSRPNMSEVVRAMNYLAADRDAGEWPAEFNVQEIDLSDGSTERRRGRSF